MERACAENKSPIEPRQANYEQRVLERDRKWKQDFGRHLSPQFVLKDYSKSPLFTNPLLKSE